MNQSLLVGVTLALVSAPALSEEPAPSETVDFFVAGGALRGLGETTFNAESGFIYKPSASHWGIGFAYNNDGHLTNNHRDGLVAQGWYTRALDDANRFELQLGTGPYFSMNNTNDANGVRLNEFKLGLLSSAALKWSPFGNGWYLRLQYNSTWVPGSFNSNALLLGAGRDFTTKDDPTDSSPIRADISAWGGTSRTTQLGTQERGAAYQLEAQYHLKDPEHLWDVAAWSVGFLSEGDTLLAHRTGIPVQTWWTSPFAHVNFSFGIGPYLAYDGARTENKTNLMGILSLRATYKVMETHRHAVELGFMYTRVASFYNRDQDIFMLGGRLLEKR